MLRRLPFVVASVVALGALAPVVARAAATKPVPVILDTDIGDDIDDTWALVALLKSPELDVRLITTDYGNTPWRAKIVARLLTIAGRTDIPIGIGIKQNDDEGTQKGWVDGYDLATYKGTLKQDGVAALVDTVLASSEPLTLIAIGPCPNLKAALEREPQIAARLRLAGMFGSVRVGYDGSTKPEPEWNVKANVAASRALLSAPWLDAVLTPLDTCGLVQLRGERYARIRDSKDPLVAALVESYRLWCPNQDWCVKDAEYVASKSSTLFDTVAVYLAIERSKVVPETLGIRVSDDGMTLVDESGPRYAWATSWKDRDGFEEWLTTRLLAPVVLARK